MSLQELIKKTFNRDFFVTVWGRDTDHYLGLMGKPEKSLEMEEVLTLLYASRLLLAELDPEAKHMERSRKSELAYKILEEEEDVSRSGDKASAWKVEAKALDSTHYRSHMASQKNKEKLANVAKGLWEKYDRLFEAKKMQIALERDLAKLR